MRPIRDGACLASIVTALIFASVILANPKGGVLVHEVAGLLLLVLIATALASAVRVRGTEPRPVPRLVGALLALIVTGSLGAGLAVGAVPTDLSALPLLGLVALVLLLADALRVGFSVPRH
jgi:hypothetical protein